MQGVGSSTRWEKLIERRNVLAGFDLTIQQDPYLPTDTTSFYPKGIPVLAWFTGSHKEYHRPADDPDTLNYEGIERITQFASNMVQDLVVESERPDYIKVEKTSQGGSRDAIRVYLGTIPDYASEDVKGVLLSGVRGGAPADKAGVKAGDIIVFFAGKEIIWCHMMMFRQTDRLFRWMIDRYSLNYYKKHKKDPPVLDKFSKIQYKLFGWFTRLPPKIQKRIKILSIIGWIAYMVISKTSSSWNGIF